MKIEQVVITCDECRAVIDHHRDLRFALAGKEFAVDLCDHHRAIFETLIAQYIRIAQPVRFKHHSVRKDAPKETAEQPSKPKRRARKSRAKANEAPTTQVQTEQSGET